ncbi:retrotransposon protein, putative, ty1-copia subclass [Tanacetum coccineum]|uniref:Retrotransposon protein, putative, ty1-copia subclass n=1 Tax=Tanacetum coccineum TaxID=301880 RepID=A0ABQ5GGE7_9ASTR
MTITVVNNSVFRAFFEKQRLTGPNFIDWYRNLRIVLSLEDKLPFLEQPIPAMPVSSARQVLPPDVLNTHTVWVKASKEIAGLILMTMDPDIQKNLEQLGAYDMLKELKTLYAQQAEQELLQTVREFHACKQEEGQSVSSYVLKMKSYIDNLERLGHAMTQNLAVSLILVSLRKEYDNFMQNYNMHGMGKTVTELHAMIKLHEQTLPKKEVAPALHAIRAGKVQKKHKNKKPQLAARGKNQEKGKSKLAYAPKPKIPHPPKNDNPAKDSICHYYLKELTLQGLRRSRKLKPRALSLYVGDGHHSSVEAIGTYHVAIPRNGIFKIDWSNSNTNDCSMYVVSNKRANINLDSTLLWHCRLGHISKKHIEKLQHDGLLNSTDNQSFEKCISCMSGKMARKPYTHQVERAKDLLGLIHIDVYGPFRTVSKQGASYSVTFTDDFSRYGYVYLLKHKHEVFETFKVFQKEVENQLGKTIKSLRSDRGGEYTSQEFLDHVKEHGIIAHRTPPYTPQHNGVSERRNRTLLDMNAEFLENSLITQEASGSLENLEIIQEEDTHPSVNTSLHHDEDDQEINEPQSDIIPIRRSTRTRHAPDRMCLYVDTEEHELGDHNEPANYKAALLDSESEKWLDAMNVEMQSMKDNEVWDLLDLPPDGKTIGSKWLFKKKTDMDGAVHTYKARLVAKGFTQTYEVDYEETFSPVADIRAIRIFVAITAFYDYEIWQMDVKTAFLNGHLSEEVYMVQPGGFVNPKYPNRDKPKLCKSQGASTPAEVQRMQRVPYASAAGSIITPGDLHWTDVKNILKYLHNTKDMFLVYGGDIKRELRVSCYIDAGYLTDVDDLKSRTGYVFVLNGGDMDWKSTKQSIFATSSAEAEYIAVYDASKEAVWIRKFISGLGIVPTIEEPIMMYCDNTGAITIANESGITKGARHYRVKVHYLREVIALGDVKIEKVHTDDNLADPFTKALPLAKHSEHTQNIGMLPTSSLM